VRYVSRVRRCSTGTVAHVLVSMRPIGRRICRLCPNQQLDPNRGIYLQDVCHLTGLFLAVRVCTDLLIAGRRA
jgi:hypothetical protein